jgi:hypothetical protein
MLDQDQGIRHHDTGREHLNLRLSGSEEASPGGIGPVATRWMMTEYLSTR